MKKRTLAATRNRALLASLLAVHSHAVAATAVPGTLINVDFNGDSGGRGGLPTPINFDGNLIQDPVTEASVAYVDADDAANDQWNGWVGTDTHATLMNQPQALLDSAGNPTTVTVEWSGFTFNYTNYTNGQDGNERTNGPNADGYYCGAGDPPARVTIAGLDQSKTYNVVALGAGDSVRFTIGDDTRSIGTWNSSSNASNWAEYAEITPDGAGKILITVSSNGGNYGMAGFQITPAGTASDSDSDGMPDSYEDSHGLNKESAADAALDPDSDGLTNLEEYQKNTDPQDEDSDDDGLRDGVETGTGIWIGLTDTGTDPLKLDTDGDTLPDGEENFSIPTGTDPNKADTDGDGFSDSREFTDATNPRDPSSNPRIKTTGQLVNVDFNGTGGNGGSTDPVTFDGDLAQDGPTALSVAMEDADQATNDTWNGFDIVNQADQPLVDTTGAETPYLLTWSGFDITYTNYLNGSGGNARTDGPNGDGHLIINGAARTGTVLINGANPARLYDVAVIAGGSDPVSLAIGADKRPIAGWTSAGNPSNWTLFTNIQPNGAGVITISVSTNGTTNFGIGGVQLTAKGTLTDADFDGMPDTYEDANGLNKNNPADATQDPDGDTLTNLREFQLSTNPQSDDSDNDGAKDNLETKTGVWAGPTDLGTDPLLADTDADGLLDGVEDFTLPNGSDPNIKDTDGDGFLDAREVADGTNPRDASSNARRKATGALVNVDFDGTGGAGGSTNPVTFDGNVALDPVTAVSVPMEDGNAEAPDFWNGFGTVNLADQPLYDSQNAETPFLLTWSGFDGIYTNYRNGRFGNDRTNGPNGDGHLLFNAGNARSGTVLISGADPAKVYDVAVIGGGSDPVAFSIGDVKRNIESWTSGANPSNWTIFDAVAPDAAGVITITVSTNNAPNFGIGGVQIVLPADDAADGFKILAISRNAANGDITLSWESAADKTYTVKWSTDTASFPGTVSGQSGLAGQAGSMTRTFPSPQPGAARIFFRVQSE